MKTGDSASRNLDQPQFNWSHPPVIRRLQSLGIKKMEKNGISIGERIAAGTLAALIMGLMAICVPVGVFVFVTRGRAIGALGIFGIFHIWATALVTVAGITGAIVGTDRTVAIYAHLWGTEEPKDLGITFALWASLIGIAVASYWMFGTHHSI